MESVEKLIEFLDRKIENNQNLEDKHKFIWIKAYLEDYNNIEKK